MKKRSLVKKKRQSNSMKSYKISKNTPHIFHTLESTLRF
ncbi:hypothetical protein HC081234_20300 [Helicobacter cinaedi]|nr:hypothetical protein HC081234_20300 [Helicobacter cinaedi]